MIANSVAQEAGVARRISLSQPGCYSRFMEFAPVFASILGCTLLSTSLAAAAAPSAAPKAPPGMRLIPSGEFRMGSDEEFAWPEERPAHRVRLTRPYLLDETEVTNAQFVRFARASAYKTVAERNVRLEDIMKQVPPGTPAPTPAQLAPGSLVFVMPAGPVDLRDMSRWWHWTPGAYWRAPEGPGSSIDGRMNHPVVHLAWEDAAAYCKWAGKRLPTEAEWERAARGGADSLPYVWGSDKPNDAAPRERWLANIWQGVFPTRNDAKDGFARTAPARSYKPNLYGLYDMAGNVWEWAADWYDSRSHARRAAHGAVDPHGPDAPLDAGQLRTQKGGSFLCHDSYCSRYRPGARQGAAADSGTSHAGVRCAKSVS